MEKNYDSQKVDDQIYQTWERSGFFNPDKRRRQETFSIAMPPPNATGELHIGHAMFLTLQDLLIRYQRMKGKAVLWLPGTDHASIATQNKVEKILLEKEGKTRYHLGRAQFLRRVNHYVRDSQHIIRKQIRKMGSSCDWSRERYTLDSGLTRAVQEVFVRLYNDGLIYRGSRIVNWCPRCGSTLADDEVEYRKVKGKFYYLKYGPVIIGTARPETKFLDKTIIVHPQDKRYKHLVGRKFMVPWINGQVEANVIADLAADMSLGTGAMTITPAHSFVDFDLAEKYNLPIRQIIDEKGNLTKQAGEFAGMKANQVRPLIVKRLQKANLIKRIDENYEHNLSICYRCDTPVEPLVSKQWFIDVNYELRITNYELRKIVGKSRASLKEIAIAVVKKGEIKIIPRRFEKTYFYWLENLRDWCISRQLWFGHRIPVYYKKPKRPIQITYFVHSASTDNEKGCSSGQADVALSKLGRKQARELGQLAQDRKFDLVFCSDLKRACETARLAFGNRFKIIKDKRLREIDYGQMSQSASQTIARIKKKKILDPFPGGESYQLVAKRIQNFLEDLVDKCPGKKVAIVSHQAPQLALAVLLKRKSWQQAFLEDWRRKKAWQPGWRYELRELTRVSLTKLVGWQRDPDTLDTWFSSGLWTFSTLGWPNIGLEVLAARHATTDAHKSNVFIGQEKETDLPLNVEGRKQAKQLAEEFRDREFDVIFTADLKRNVETAKMVNKYHNVPIIKDQRLLEYRFGFMNGKTLEELRRQYPDIPDWKGVKFNRRYLNEETPLQMKKRVESFIKDLKQRYANKKIFIVTSAGVLDFFYLIARGKKFQEIKNIYHQKGVAEKYLFKNTDLTRFHPTSVMETGYDILFFWVARMILMSTYVLGEVPFRTVYLHGLVRDKLGRKMSKSLGNGIDPLDMIKKYGADAVRLSLIIGTTPGNDSRLYEEKIAGYRNFVNKIWNIARYILTMSDVKCQLSNLQFKTQNLSLADRWILVELAALIKRVSRNLDKYRFSRAGEDIYKFMWSKLADWYIEATKIEQDPHQPALLQYILEKCLIMLHPFTPFITEHIWEKLKAQSSKPKTTTQNLKLDKPLLMIEPWVDRLDFKITKKNIFIFGNLQKIVSDIRNYRSINKIPAGTTLEVKWMNDSATLLCGFKQTRELIEGLSGIKFKKVPQRYEFLDINKVKINYPQITFLKFKKEITQKEKEELKNYIKSLEVRLKDKAFLTKAPAEVIKEEKARLLAARARLRGLTFEGS